MQVLMVVDVETIDGWEDKIEENNDQRKKVAETLMKEIGKRREKNETIVFVIFPPGAQYPKTQTSYKNTGGENVKCIGCHCNTGHLLAGFLEHRHEKSEPVFIKTNTNAFTNEDLAEYLRSKGVTEIALAGCERGFCIKDTAVGALREGFGVVLLSDCVHPPCPESHERYEETKNEAWLRRVREAALYENPDREISLKIE
jgi:nicotinamidase-related amidase